MKKATIADTIPVLEPVPDAAESREPQPAENTADLKQERRVWDKPINQDDQKLLQKTVVELANKAKKTSKAVSIKAVYDAFPNFDPLYVDAMLAKLVSEDKILVEDQTIYLTF